MDLYANSYEKVIKSRRAFWSSHFLYPMCTCIHFYVYTYVRKRQFCQVEAIKMSEIVLARGSLIEEDVSACIL